MITPTKPPLVAEPVVDGRRLRSEASRGRIVAAMIAIVREQGGAGLPPAELVADRAGVGLRTVFRLFEDMDGVYRAMQAMIIAEAEPLMAGRPNSHSDARVSRTAIATMPFAPGYPAPTDLDTKAI